MIDTERLLLRVWENNDAESLYKYAKRSEIANMGGWPIHADIVYSKKIIQDILIPECNYAIILKENNILIGNIGLQRQEQSNLSIRNNEAEIGYWIGTEHWGMGYAPEAVKGVIEQEFKRGEFKTIWAGCFEENKNSMRVLKKCGFEFVRTEKDKYWPMIDAYHTTHIMKIPIFE